MQQWIGALLEVQSDRLGSFPTFLEPGGSVAARGPQPPALPARVRIINASVESLSIEAHGIGHAEDDHLAVLERNQTVIEVAGGHRHILAKSEGVVLIDPGIIAGLGAV